ncbi:hypothetical protein OPV22_016379 [Ensete ventricosum]|uniref:Uncharacterized protein n=1 Tax=Ensete ventricosum TaxID=4639 RepID=A0AAV8QKZ0_ENSVE|nr:hypothetical protein OPV22_016379 [Ensete ventricosum]
MPRVPCSGGGVDGEYALMLPTEDLGLWRQQWHQLALELCDLLPYSWPSLVTCLLCLSTLLHIEFFMSGTRMKMPWRPQNRESPNC